jgi:hypothetical protein
MRLTLETRHAPKASHPKQTGINRLRTGHRTQLDRKRNLAQSWGQFTTETYSLAMFHARLFRNRLVTGVCEDTAFLVKRGAGSRSAGVLARNNVSCKRVWRGHLARVSWAGRPCYGVFAPLGTIPRIGISIGLSQSGRGRPRPTAHTQTTH